MVLHLDASSLKGLIGTGDPLDQAWPDLSGNGNHADNRSGDPQWIEDGLNGRPIVKFDGDDLIWTTKNFEPDLTNYTLLSVARYTGGGNGRVISTRARNFIFGFHSGHVRKFHADGWAATTTTKTQNGTFILGMLTTATKPTSGLMEFSTPVTIVVYTILTTSLTRSSWEVG